MPNKWLEEKGYNNERIVYEKVVRKKVVDTNTENRFSTWETIVYRHK